ncbi:hypothetical protein GOV09_05345 [Candidatus Woesearchaeota archaeon]|nr:hypothetical protein [Candidatus Woesearchaeota archaeon]
MAEKKLVVDGLQLTYTGMFDIEEFFMEVDRWMEGHHMEREIKKKLEHVEQHGKKMEYIFELWEQHDYSRVVVRMKALFRDVVEFDLKRNDVTRHMQKGHCLIVIDGFVEEDLEHRWVQKPGFVFIRTLYDKLIWKYWSSAHDSHCIKLSNGLYNELLNYFKKYKY